MLTKLVLGKDQVVVLRDGRFARVLGWDKGDAYFVSLMPSRLTRRVLASEVVPVFQPHRESWQEWRVYGV